MARLVLYTRGWAWKRARAELWVVRIWDSKDSEEGEGEGGAGTGIGVLDGVAVMVGVTVVRMVGVTVVKEIWGREMDATGRREKGRSVDEVVGLGIGDGGSVMVVVENTTTGEVETSGGSAERVRRKIEALPVILRCCISVLD